MGGAIIRDTPTFICVYKEIEVNVGVHLDKKREREGERSGKEKDKVRGERERRKEEILVIIQYFYLFPEQFLSIVQSLKVLVLSQQFNGRL